jgi:hypothetical protein
MSILVAHSVGPRLAQISVMSRLILNDSLVLLGEMVAIPQSGRAG